jgi:predicted ATPase
MVSAGNDQTWLGINRAGAARGGGCSDTAGLSRLAGYQLTTSTDVLSLLAEAYERGNEVEEGLSVLAEALTVVDKTTEGYWEAELHRLKGELLLQQAVPDQHHTEACFQQALAIARRQQAKSLELRAAMSLSRLWQQQGRRAEARDLLAPIYGWFTEGFDTADLQEAKALLDEWS